MKRILFISQYLNRNGTEAFMMNVFRGIDRDRFAIDFLLYSWNETDYSKEVEASGCKVWRVPCRKESPYMWHKSLNSFFKKHAKEYYAIHFCGNSLTSIAPIYYAYKYGVPVRIVHAHNSSASGMHNRILHKLKCNYVKCISTHHFACSTLAAKWFFGNSKNSVIIKNGIDTNRFQFNIDSRRRMRSMLSIDDKTKVIGHVGRFVHEKNHRMIVNIFNEYNKTNVDCVLLLVGIGPLMDEVKKQASELGITDKILFLGERNDVNDIMQAMDIFLMPSYFEGLPFVLIEAECSGLPCVISDVINKDISITPNVTFLSLNETPKYWAGIINDKLKSYERTDCSRFITKAGYSISDTINYLEQIYSN